MANSLVKKQPKFSVAIQSEGYKKLVNNTLGDPKRAARFIGAITSAVSTNPDLQECDSGTILSAGLLGESLNLSPSPQLGQYYLVPFNDNKNGRKVAQFQIGYKGYLQLAMRSGQYKTINVTPIKEGELLRCDRINEIYEFSPIEDDEIWEKSKTIGYYAMFEYLNGMRKGMYWSREKMQAHANKYSMGYKAKKGYTFWEKDFDGMAMKTMLRQLISKWGIMSTEMQEAVTGDMAVIHEDNSKEYVDNIPELEYSEVPAEEQTAGAPQEPEDVLGGEVTEADPLSE